MSHHDPYYVKLWNLNENTYDEEVIFDIFMKSLIWDDVSNLHFLIHTNQISLENINNTFQIGIPRSSRQLGFGGGGSSSSDNSDTSIFPWSSSSSALNAQCPICRDSVSGTRFAAHLNKCTIKAQKQEDALKAKEAKQMKEKEKEVADQANPNYSTI